MSCPICEVKIEIFKRYPNAVCGQCFDKTVTEKGEKIEFYNINHGGGFKSIVNNIEGEIHDCYINGIQCYAEEHRFGGIVISKSKNLKII